MMFVAVKRKKEKEILVRRRERAFVADTGLQARGEGGAACAAPW